jgi:uncharacterized protein (DUF934 family)
MPKLIRLTTGEGGAARLDWAEDSFAHLADEEAPGPNVGDVLVSFPRFRTDGDGFLAQGRRVGVRMKPDEAVEELAPSLPQVAMVALEFPKFRDGRAFSSAALLRERYGYSGEVRAVGDVLRDLAKDMVRVGFDAFEPADGSDPDTWARSAFRFRHVYQRAADARPPAFLERTGEG